MECSTYKPTAVPRQEQRQLFPLPEFPGNIYIETQSLASKTVFKIQRKSYRWRQLFPLPALPGHIYIETQSLASKTVFKIQRKSYRWCKDTF